MKEITKFAINLAKNSFNKNNCAFVRHLIVAQCNRMFITF